MRALLGCVALVAACSRWTAQDSVLEAAYVASIAIDWHQTTGITEACLESNPVLGACGDRVPPALYFPTTIALHVVVARVLPPRWRELFQSFTLGLEASTIYNNALVTGPTGRASSPQPRIWLAPRRTAR